MNSTKKITNKIEKLGYGGCLTGDEVWFSLESGELIKIRFTNKDDQWKFYCNDIKLTIEIMPKGSSSIERF